MLFMKISIAEEIEEKRQESLEFQQMWDESREEYKLIGEMISLRKQEKIIYR